MVAITQRRGQHKRTTAMAPDERRSMIVTATLPLLLENGEMVTTRQIAAAAGIAEGTIFRVFADKDAVISAVLEAALDVAPLERAIEAVDPNLDLGEALEAVVVIMQRRVVDIWRLYSTLGSRSHHPNRHSPVVLEALVSLFSRYRDHLTVPPADAARLLRALTLAMTHPMLVGQPMASPEIVNLFLHGVGATGSPC
jgi:AcrR family transcriptional regulator